MYKARAWFGATVGKTAGKTRNTQRKEIEATKEELRRQIGDLVAFGSMDPMRVIALCLQRAGMKELDALLWPNAWYEAEVPKDDVLFSSTRAQLEDYAIRVEERLVAIGERIEQLEAEETE